MILCSTVFVFRISKSTVFVYAKTVKQTKCKGSQVEKTCVSHWRFQTDCRTQFDWLIKRVTTLTSVSIYTQRDGERERETDRQTETGRDRQTQRDRLTDKNTETDRQTDVPTDRQTDRQRQRQQNEFKIMSQYFGLGLLLGHFNRTVNTYVARAAQRAIKDLPL